MSMDFLDSLIARELGTAALVRPVPAFYGEALEEQVEREPEPGPLPSPSSRAARRDRTAQTSRGLPARPPREARASERREERVAAPPPSRPSPPPAVRPVPPATFAPAPPRPHREADADPRALEPVSRPAQSTDAAGAVEPAAGTEAPHAGADEAEAPAAARADTSDAAAFRTAAVPAGSYTPAVPPPALRAARGRTDPAGDEAAITISIGRIDVRAAAPPAPVPAPLPRRPSTSLDDWLAECDATGRG